MEFFDVHFSYIDVEKMGEKFISVPEQGGGSLNPDGPLNPGVMSAPDPCQGDAGAFDDGGTTFCGSSRRVRRATGRRSIDD